MIKADAIRAKYPAETRQWAINMINEMRKVVAPILGPEQEAGRRFKDTAHVFLILESNTSVERFVKYPHMAIDNALKEAASSDWYYSHEKDYGEVA